MSDERWGEVFSRAPRTTLTPVEPLRVPLVRHPTCPEHCSGRHETEAILGCRGCNARVARLVAHEWQHQEGHYFYAQESLNGAPSPCLECPVCEGQLVRL